MEVEDSATQCEEFRFGTVFGAGYLHYRNNGLLLHVCRTCFHEHGYIDERSV